MATHSSTLVWKIPWREAGWWVIVHGVSKSETRLSTAHTHTVGKILTHPKKGRVGPCLPTHLSPAVRRRWKYFPLQFQLKFHFVVFYFLEVENQSQLHSLPQRVFLFQERQELSLRVLLK